MLNKRETAKRFIEGILAIFAPSTCSLKGEKCSALAVDRTLFVLFHFEISRCACPWAYHCSIIACKYICVIYVIELNPACSLRYLSMHVFQKISCVCQGL